jgi:hypothetical protein
MVCEDRKSLKFHHSLFFALCSLLFVIASCKTMPDIPNAVLGETDHIPLEDGAFVYVFADVQAAKPILELLPIAEMNDKQARQMLDKTSTAVAALYPPASGRRYQAAAWGAYPSFQAGVALGMSKYWKKQRSAAGLSYWHSPADRLSIALNPKHAFIAAWEEETPGDPVTASPGVKLPEGLNEFRRGAIVSCWLEDPGPWLDRIFEQAGIPLQLPAQRIFLSLFPAARLPGEQPQEAGQKYEAMIRMRFAGAAQARSLVFLFSLARNFMAGAETGRMAALLFANPPSQNGSDLDIKTSVLTETQIALLFALFSVY